MTDRFYTDLIFILAATIVAAILGYLIGRLTKGVQQKALKKSLETCYKHTEDLKKKLEKADLDKKSQGTVAKSYAAAPMASSSLASSSSSSVSAFDSSKAKLALGKTIKQNDLKIVEGIGPKIEELLNKDGITTWEHLSKAPEARLKNILKEGGDSFLFHVPATWPKQASLAFEGKWAELKNYQDKLDGGKEVN